MYCLPDGPLSGWFEQSIKVLLNALENLSESPKFRMSHIRIRRVILYLSPMCTAFCPYLVTKMFLLIKFVWRNTEFN